MKDQKTDRSDSLQKSEWLSRRNAALRILAVALSVLLITVLAYSEVLDYFFTGMDSLTLIETGRIGSPADLNRVLAKPLMYGTDFTRVLLYYRPLTSLSYGLDYLIWGLNPLGYQAVDLALHVIVCVLVFFLVSILAGGRWLAAFLSAILFAAHPIHVEVIPVIANRQEVLASAFILLPLIFFTKYAFGKRAGLASADSAGREAAQRRGSGEAASGKRTTANPLGDETTAGKRRRLLYLSLVFYILALASKELAVLLPCLVLAFCLVFAREETFGGKIRVAVRAISGYVVATAAWFAWRAYVLGGFGGYVGGTAGAAPTSRDIGHDTLNYFLDVVYPLGNITARSVPLGIMLAVCLVFGAALALSVTRIRALSATGGQSKAGGDRSGSGKRGKRSRGGKLHGKNSGRASGVAERSGGVGTGGKPGDAGAVREIKTAGYHTSPGRFTLWFAVWLFVPLIVSIWTGTLSHRNMYFPSIALCVLISFAIVHSGGYLLALARGGAQATGPARLWRGAANLAALAFAGVVAIMLLAFSPAVHGCSDWRAASNAASLLLEHLDSYAPSFKDGSRLEFKDLPSRVSLEKRRTDTARFRFFQAREMSVLSVWSLNSWLKFKHPDKNLKAVVTSRAEIRHLPVKVEFEVSSPPGADVAQVRPVYYVAME